MIVEDVTKHVGLLFYFHYTYLVSWTPCRTKVYVKRDQQMALHYTLTLVRLMTIHLWYAVVKV